MTVVLGLLAAAAAHAGAGPLQPLTPKDYDAFQFERSLPNEDQGQGGEFSVGARSYLRLDGRHLKIRTAAGLQTCIVTPAAAAAMAAGAGSADCHGLRLTLRPGRGRSTAGAPTTLVATQAGVARPISGVWQELD